jgi:hypothetical protein
MFNWPEGFKDQLNLLIQALLFVATLVLIRVGWKQAKAADAQAKAADAQVAAANEGSGANMCGRGSKARGEVRTMRRVLHSRLQGQFGS